MRRYSHTQRQGTTTTAQGVFSWTIFFSLKNLMGNRRRLVRNRRRLAGNRRRLVRNRRRLAGNRRRLVRNRRRLAGNRRRLKGNHLDPMGCIRLSHETRTSTRSVPQGRRSGRSSTCPTAAAKCASLRRTNTNCGMRRVLCPGPRGAECVRSCTAVVADPRPLRTAAGTAFVAQAMRWGARAGPTRKAHPPPPRVLGRGGYNSDDITKVRVGAGGGC